MDKRLTTAAIALALGLAWSAAPVMAQQSTTEKMKEKAESAKEKVEEKATDLKDKAVDLKDKAKDKAVDLKDRAKAKMHRTASKAAKPDVMVTQQALKDKGFDPGPADGRMGAHTRAALRDYQKKEGLTATGRLDNDTASKLGVPMSGVMTPAPSASPATPGAPPAIPQDKTAPPATRATP